MTWPIERVKWPVSASELTGLQEVLAAASPAPWLPQTGVDIGGVFVCFGRGGSGFGAAGDSGWAGGAVVRDGRVIEGICVTGTAGGPYLSGCLALREGGLLESAACALAELPDVLLVNATGRDHPRRAGLALHLGAVLGVPTVGVTHRPLAAGGDWPESTERGATAPLILSERQVGCWVRTQRSCRPLAVHAAWRTSPETARRVVLAATAASRTPEPLREARRRARTARSDSVSCA